MKSKIEIPITGVVMGFPYDDESETDAQTRLVLDAEMHGNEGKARIHLSIAEPPAVIDEAATERVVKQ